MPTVTITRNSVCAGGEHVNTTVSIGPRSRSVPFDLEKMRGPVEDEALEEFVRVAMRIATAGKTQAETAAISSISVVVTAI